jgi:soluble lytic murein transglycosylase-like protein
MTVTDSTALAAGDLSRGRPRGRRPSRALVHALCAFTLAALPALSVSAAVWKRTRADGTEEFTNARPAGNGWTAVKSAGRGSAAPPAAGATPASPAASGGGGGTISASGSKIWSRENEDGTVEFTNLSPSGGRWKVLYRTGPGKASAVRGASDLVPARDTSSTRFSRYDRHIRDQQAFFGIPQTLVRAVIKVESDYDPRVVSSAGCVGLMQLAPETARSMGVTDIWDPRQNIMGGSRYLQTLARRFCRTPGRGAAGFTCAAEELVKVIAGYHAGPGAVDKYGGMPPYETTRAYVQSVLTRFEEFRHRERQSAVLTQLAPAKP